MEGVSIHTLNEKRISKILNFLFWEMKKSVLSKAGGSLLCLLIYASSKFSCEHPEISTRLYAPEYRDGIILLQASFFITLVTQEMVGVYNNNNGNN